MSKEKKEIPKVFTIASFGEIMNERPDGMPYSEYVEKRREQTKKLKRRLKGFMVWKSNYILTDGAQSPWGKLERWGTERGPIPSLKIR